jgi:hypothetical protein
VLFKRRLWAGIADGSVTLAFRRWKRPAARAGALHRTPAGVIEIISVSVVDEGEIGEEDARRAGFAERAELLAALAGREGEVHRVEFRYAGEDPRRRLREHDRLGEAEIGEVAGRLRRLDRAARSGPWTVAVLELIARRPGERAAELAAELGRERLPFKRDVRKLKELGLTESLPVGYRLSPRGRAVLAALADRAD